MKSHIFITAGHRPVEENTHNNFCLKGSTFSGTAFQAEVIEASYAAHCASFVCGYESLSPCGLQLNLLNKRF